MLCKYEQCRARQNADNSSTDIGQEEGKEEQTAALVHENGPS